ncbi:LPS export ABC transporter permease LptF [Candidatus Profftia sp. (ex Adelges kitamiensis)]|uniref:LPS export ABC transporter permease LptF n=1 Tax=Candidatus Profftia sp. (ex Adelges kitamiensis) TaxID=2864218 RepID=UPI001CE27D81|nr:LPS export ABC transporter permease LptF [Candidatus Profftia sp. (ex Adelges kitamiensis)]
MIITRYLVREILKSQVSILLILLLIFFCQKIIRILGAVVDGEIPINLVLSMLILGVPELAQLILPLSLFLGLLMTLGKLYHESEIVVMYACGLGKGVIIKTAMLLALITGIFASINAFWISPLSSSYLYIVMAEAKANPGLASMVEGQFQSSKNGNYVLFIGDVKGKKFKNIFLVQFHSKNIQCSSIIVADTGHIERSLDGFQQVLLDTGTRYEVTMLLQDFRITHFMNYKAIIGHQDVSLNLNNAEQATMRALWHSKENNFRAELHWRITLVFSVFVMALIIITLSGVNPREGLGITPLPAILLYLIFFLLQSSQRSNASKGKIDPFIGVWVINMLYLLLAIILNIWDTLLIRKLRARITGKRVI